MTIKFKKVKWLDTDSLTTVYGIKALYCGRWMDCCEGSEPLFFDSEEHCNDKLAELRAELIN